MKRNQMVKMMFCTALLSAATVVSAFGAYSDVPAGYKYAGDIAVVKELGIMSGNSSTYFGAEDDLTYKEAFAIVAKAHSKVHGKTIPKSNGVWYEGALRYCRENGLLHPGMERGLSVAMAEPGKTTYDLAIFRPHLTYMLANILPEEGYTEINTITRIPDSSTMCVKIDETKFEGEMTIYQEEDKDVVMLYRAGIMEGYGSDHSYRAYRSVTRGEAAAYINRLFHPEDRVRFDILPLEDKMEYTAAPDGSNVGKITGTIYPREGDLYDGKPITRDPVTGVLGYGNGQKGGIYLGLLTGYHVQTGEAMYHEIGNYLNHRDYDEGYMGGSYQKRGQYIYFANEWVKIEVAMRNKLDAAYPVAADRACADIYGNLLPGAEMSDENVFFIYSKSSECWMPKSWDLY